MFRYMYIIYRCKFTLQQYFKSELYLYFSRGVMVVLIVDRVYSCTAQSVYSLAAIVIAWFSL